jgi:hypothetical protein
VACNGSTEAWHEAITDGSGGSLFDGEKQSRRREMATALSEGGRGSRWRLQAGGDSTGDTMGDVG